MMRHGRRGRWLAAGLAGAGLLLAGFAAGAAEFEVKPLASPPRAVIFASGKIERGDFKRFQQALREAKRIWSEMHPLLVLESPGGVAQEAFSIGRAVKRGGIATAVLSGSYCASACSIIFFGGYDTKAKAHDRTVYGGARLGVHHWSPASIVGWDPKRPIPPSMLADLEKRAKQEFQSYYEDMRVSPDIRRRTYETPFSSIHLLSWAEMAASAINTRVTAQTPHDGLMPIEIRCRGACPTPREDYRPRAVTASAGGSLDTSDKPIPGTTYLRSWARLIDKRVRIAECTLWRPASARVPCLILEDGARRGFLVAAASEPETPGWAVIRERCAAAEPADDCRVELTGTLRMTSSGPVLTEATARFLDAPEPGQSPPAGTAAAAPAAADHKAVTAAADPTLWR